MVVIRVPDGCIHGRTPGALKHEGNMRKILRGSILSPRDNELIMDSEQLIAQFQVQWMM